MEWIYTDSRYSALESKAYLISLAANEEGYKNVSVVYDFEMAVEFASMIAEEGDAVLLSPACSSFDRFADYEERGNKFIELVESL